MGKNRASNPWQSQITEKPLIEVNRPSGGA
jgi:hypothetical protein